MHAEFGGWQLRAGHWGGPWFLWTWKEVTETKSISDGTWHTQLSPAEIAVTKLQESALSG